MTPFITTNFSSAQLEPIKVGIQKFITLIQLFSDPLYGQWIGEEQDLIAALESVSEAFASTHRMVGKQKYQGLNFDAPGEVKKDMQVFLLTGLTAETDATERRRNAPMYYLVIEPTINLFYTFDHAKMIEVAQRVTSGVIEMVRDCTNYSHRTAALATQREVQLMIRARNEMRKSASAKRKPRKSKAEVLLEMFAGLPDVELDEEGLTVE